MTEAVCKVLLVYPRFDSQSFWKLTAACELTGRRCLSPPLGLITVAALLPADWSFRLIDRNAEELEEADLQWADLVMTGGMIPQQLDTLHIIDLCKARGRPVAVGGPDPTSSPHIYTNADFQIIGEAEGLMNDFASAWAAGQRCGVFEAEKFKTDVTTSPTPRFDLLKRGYYVDIDVQFSRGCPFTCEFCDIIELYGRVPRTKSTQQMLAELDALYRLGHRGIVVFVDDNLIGNKKAVKAFLPHLCEWQERHKYPFEFSTQASINLADDDALLALMRRANFRMVFIGIETPDSAVLISTQKKQNTRRNLAGCIHKIYRSGMLVTAGFILGFDGEKTGISEDMIACIEDAHIPLCMVGLLTALPNTQLARRLVQEGRVKPGTDLSLFDPDGGGDQCTAGLNFETLRPKRDILADYKLVLGRIYEPHAYFRRVRLSGLMLVPPKLKTKFRLGVALDDLRSLGRLVWRLVTRHPELIRIFGPVVVECLYRNPAAVKQVVSQMFVYLHAGPFSHYVVEHIEHQMAEIEAEAGTYPSNTDPVADGDIARKAIGAAVAAH